MEMKVMFRHHSTGYIPLAYGVIAGIAPPHERGGYVGNHHIGFNSTTSRGHIVGDTVIYILIHTQPGRSPCHRVGKAFTREKKPLVMKPLTRNLE